jgi:small subunit ribosomal protein S17
MVEAVTSPTSTASKKRTLVGVVVSDVNDKTIIVSVERRAPHRLYRKVITKTKRYHAHDEQNQATLGDIVRIIESRPMSKLKRWALTEILVGRDVAEVEATDLDSSFVDEVQRSAARASAETQMVTEDQPSESPEDPSDGTEEDLS